jgi:hypothetical protein
MGGRPDPVDYMTKVMLQPFIIIQLEAKSSGQNMIWDWPSGALISSRASRIRTAGTATDS